MKHLIHLLMLLGACLANYSCNDLNSLEKLPNCENTERNYSKKEELTYQLLNRIYKETYDGHNIDFEKFNNIISEDFNISKDELYSLHQIYTRSQNYSDEKYQLPKEIQPLYGLLKESVEDKDLSKEEINTLLAKSRSLSQENRVLFETILEAVNSTLLALERISNEQNLTRGFFDRSWRENLASLACNVSTGSIGAIYGSAAGVIASGVFAASAVASKGATVVVGIAVGAILSTICC